MATSSDVPRAAAGRHTVPRPVSLRAYQILQLVRREPGIPPAAVARFLAPKGRRGPVDRTVRRLKLAGAMALDAGDNPEHGELYLTTLGRQILENMY